MKLVTGEIAEIVGGVPGRATEFSVDRARSKVRGG